MEQLSVVNIDSFKDKYKWYIWALEEDKNFFENHGCSTDFNMRAEYDQYLMYNKYKWYSIDELISKWIIVKDNIETYWTINGSTMTIIKKGGTYQNKILSFEKYFSTEQGAFKSLEKDCKENIKYCNWELTKYINKLDKLYKLYPHLKK